MVCRKYHLEKIMQLQTLLGVALPIVQAPMAGVQDSALALAVSNAGGLGSLPCAMLTPDALRQELEVLRHGTDHPFNLNFFCHTPPTPDDAAQQGWLDLFGAYYQTWGIDPTTVGAGAARVPFNHAMAELVCEYRPAVVSFHFGLPAPELLDMVRRSGAKIVSSATTVAEARWLQAHGTDAIIAQGLEAGGHRGMFLSSDLNTQLGTLALLPQVVDAVQVPVIAAGGIADARGVRAALALGAAGVQVGTAYLLCPEARTSALHRAALQSEQAHTTALTNVFTGRPARGIVNRLVRELGPMHPQAPQFPLATAASAPLRSRAESAGNSDFSPLWAGQNVSGCKAIPAGRLTQELAQALA